MSVALRLSREVQKRDLSLELLQRILDRQEMEDLSRDWVHITQ